MSEDYNFHPEQNVYHGKVRDVYSWDDELVMVASDRISAFDHILPREIPYKGQVLNLVASHFLEASSAIVPNWLKAIPHPNVAVGLNCKPIKLEMVVRAYLAGHAWRIYKSGGREICGVTMPEGMRESDKFPTPIITPATKADEGHDEDISEEEILNKKIVSLDQWEKLKQYSLDLFELGTRMAAKRGLILVDTKYEFGMYQGQIYLIDEIHTPDSSRYYIADGYEEKQNSGQHQSQLSKEFVREWLMKHNFQGLENQIMPEMPDAFVELVSDRYIDLYQRITGKTFVKNDLSNLDMDIVNSVNNYYESL